MNDAVTTEASKLAAQQERERQQIQDKLDLLVAQRNAAHNETVEISALYKAAVRRIAELEATVADLKRQG